MPARVTFHTRVGGRCTILQQLPRHWPQSGRSDESAPNPAYTRRHWLLAAFAGAAVFRSRSLLLRNRLARSCWCGDLLLSRDTRRRLPEGCFEATQQNSTQERENQEYTTTIHDHNSV